jgi:hypothetical protein
MYGMGEVIRWAEEWVVMRAMCKGEWQVEESGVGMDGGCTTRIHYIPIGLDSCFR